MRVGHCVAQMAENITTRLATILGHAHLVAMFTRAMPASVFSASPHRAGWHNYGLAVLSVGAIAAVGAPLLGHLDLANIAMLFPLAVLFSAVKLGRGPAVLAAFLSVALFDLFFVPPHFTLGVSDVQYLLTFAVLLLVALTTAELAARLRRQLEAAEQRERQTQALYGLARELSAALAVEQIDGHAKRFSREVFGCDGALWLPDAQNRLQPVASGCAAEAPPAALAVWLNGQAQRTSDGAGKPIRWLPLRAPMRVRGVLALSGEPAEPPPAPLLDAFSSLLAIALERLHYVAVARRTELEMESERLRNSLLAALSHDLRTPLTAIAGLADAVALTAPPLSSEQAELVAAIGAEAQRSSAQVAKLLEMARIESGGVRLRREWQPLEEVVGAALQARASLLGRHELAIDLPAELPLVDIDSVLFERVLCNLLENAAQYTPPGSRIEIRARADEDEIILQVGDNGLGLPPDRIDTLFAKFTRGHTESANGGFGLGLAIVQAVVAAHGGRVRGFNRATGGACFEIALPLGTAPALPQEAA